MGPATYPTCRGLVLEAELVAYIVAAEHELDSAGYSFAYVAGWGAQDPAAVDKTAGRVIDTAAAFIEAAAERLDPGTLHDLAARAEQGRTSAAALASTAQETRAAVAPQAREALDLVQEHYQQALAGDRRALDLLAARGISAEAAAAAGAGVAAGGEDRLPGAVSALAEARPGAAAFAPAGTALSGEHARQLAAAGKTVIVALDGDPPGRDAAARLYDTLTGAGIGNPRQAVLRDGTDPADLAAADPARLAAALAGPRPLIAAKIERIIDDRPGDFIPGRVAAMRQAVAALAAHPDPAERAQLTAAARQRLDLGRDTVQAITTDTPAAGAAR